MKKWQQLVRIVLVSGIFGGAACACWAQRPVVSQTAPAVSVQNAYIPSADPSTLLLAGQKVIQLIDQGMASQLWQHVSFIVRDMIDANEFSRQIYASRLPLGVVLERRWIGIAQIQHPGSDLAPSGTYVTVTFLTSFEARSEVQEQVSFYLDEDDVWRIAGYVLH